MMKNNILIIKKNNEDVFFKGIPNIEKYYLCSFNNLLFKVLYKFNIPLLKIFFGNWKRKLSQYGIVILFDNGYNSTVAKYIKRKNPNIKIIFWYWNSILEYNNEIIKSKFVDEIWTYNKFDAEKFNIKYNPQFYLKTKEFDQDEEYKSDIIFMGRNKGRSEKLGELKEKLELNKLKCDFNIIDKNNYMKYDDYLKKVNESKCILDFSFTEPCGLSLRPLESLFFEKKLITNNKDIVNYDFYNPNNIFVLGIDNLENINNFINKSYEKIDKGIVEYYSFYAWLNRFKNNASK